MKPEPDEIDRIMILAFRASGLGMTASEEQAKSLRAALKAAGFAIVQHGAAEAKRTFRVVRSGEPPE